MEASNSIILFGKIIARLPHRNSRARRFPSYSSSSVADISDYLLKGCNWRNAPNCPDYVGPVFIDRTSDGRGRGLFASQDFHAGDPLIVSNPFAAALNDPCSVQLFSKINTIVRESATALQQLYFLAGSNFHDGLPVPSVSLFDRSIDPIETPKDLKFDEARIMHIINVNSFEGELSAPKSKPATKLTGLWLLPSFINHSCSPNASRLVVGEAMFIHAASDIRAKEEITIAYTDVLYPFRKRQEALEKMGFGFRCKCKRCLAERSVEKPLQEISERFHSLHGKAVDEVHAVITAKVHTSSDSFPACKELSSIFNVLRKEMSSFNHLTELQKQYILAGYSPSFLGKWLITGYRSGFAQVSDFVNSTALEVVEAMKSGVPGMHRTLAFITLLAAVAQKGEGNLALVHKLLQLAMDECIRVYGKQKPEVTMKLMEQASEVVPFFEGS